MRKSSTHVSFCRLKSTVIRRTRKHRVDKLESLVDLLTDLSAGEDDLAADEDQEDNLGLHHAVNETREQLGLIGTEVVVAASQTLQPNGELDVARPDDVLDLEVCELRIEPELLDDTRVFARGQLRVVLRLGAGDHHLARGEDQSGRLGFANAHDHSSKTLQQTQTFSQLGL